IFDAHHLASIAQGRPEVIEEIIDMALSDLPERFQEADIALERGDVAAVVQGLHSLAGIAGSVGGRRLERLARESEALARQD
ncbi:Hpt domain-containing protein, partial [Klebsiella pneumoniae]